MARAREGTADPGKLTPEQVRAYRSDGFLCPIRVLRHAEVARCRAAIAQLEAHVADPTSISLLHLFFGWAYELSTHPAVVGPVAAVLGPDLVVRSTLVLNKPARHPGRVPWHQDDTKISAAETAPQCSAWIALTDSNPENGCMRVLPGSHRHDMLPHDPAGGETLGVGATEVRMAVNEAEARDLVLAPGEMSLHDRRIIHGSEPNRSRGARIGFIVRFVAPPWRAAKIPVVPIRGGRPAGLELLDRAPSYDLHEGLHARRELLRERGLD